jgi:hypothetical protein
MGAWNHDRVRSAGWGSVDLFGEDCNMTVTQIIIDGLQTFGVTYACARWFYLDRRGEHSRRRAENAWANWDNEEVQRELKGRTTTWQDKE